MKIAAVSFSRPWGDPAGKGDEQEMKILENQKAMLLAVFGGCCFLVMGSGVALFFYRGKKNRKGFRMGTLVSLHPPGRWGPHERAETRST